MRQKRRAKRLWWRCTHDERDKVKRRLGKPDLGLQRLVLSVWKAIVQEEGSVGEAVADMLDISVRDRLHDKAHRIMSNGSDGGHVGRFAFISLIAQVTAQPLQNLVLSWVKKFSQVLPSDSPKKRSQIFECLVRLLDDKIQVQERNG